MYIKNKIKKIIPSKETQYKIKKGLYITGIIALSIGSITTCSRKQENPCINKYVLKSQIRANKLENLQTTNKNYFLNKTEQNELKKIINEEKEKLETRNNQNARDNLEGLLLGIAVMGLYVKLDQLDNKYEHNVWENL